MCQSWAKLVNANGGILVKAYGKQLPVKFIIYDDKSEPAESAKFYERLVTVDKVHILLGPFSSHITTAAVTVRPQRRPANQRLPSGWKTFRIS